MIILNNDRMGSNKILKNLEDKKIFLNTILNPPSPNENLRKAYLDYQKIITKNI